MSHTARNHPRKRVFSMGLLINKDGFLFAAALREGILFGAGAWGVGNGMNLESARVDGQGDLRGEEEDGCREFGIHRGDLERLTRNACACNAMLCDYPDVGVIKTGAGY